MVRKAQLTFNQLEAMKCGPKPKDKTEDPATNEEQPVALKNASASRGTANSKLK